MIDAIPRPVAGRRARAPADRRARHDALEAALTNLKVHNRKCDRTNFMAGASPITCVEAFATERKTVFARTGPEVAEMRQRFTYMYKRATAALFVVGRLLT